MGNMMYNRRLLIGFLVLVSTAHCLTCRTEITKPVEYTCDEQGQTLIFRRQPLWYDVVPVMSVFLIGLGFFAFRSEFTPTKNAPAVKAIAIILPSAMGSLGIADFLYKKYRMKDPILILNKKGIWHEPWNTQILWSDVTCVECKKVDQYVSHCVGQAPILIHYETHIGFSWEIRLHTKIRYGPLMNGQRKYGMQSVLDWQDPATLLNKMAGSLANWYANVIAKE